MVLFTFTTFPEEIDQYDSFNIKEALSNSIAHQDYTQRGRINFVEREDGFLIFSNLGEFLPGSVENVIQNDEPSTFYRNDFLARAMVNLNMIDTVGSGIKRMYRLQSQRFFPMPDYDFSGGKVKITLTGKILDADFTRALIRNPDLTLPEIFMLDKVQKKKELTEVLNKKKVGVNKEEIKNLLWDKLPNVLSDAQKLRRISVVLTELKHQKQIENTGSDTKPLWKLVSSALSTGQNLKEV